MVSFSRPLANEGLIVKSPFKKKSKRRQRHEARERAKIWDRYGEAIRLTLIGGGIVTVAAALAKVVVR